LSTPESIARSATPIVRLSRFGEGALVFAKAEHLQPSGSIFDRIASPIVHEHGHRLEHARVGLVAGSGSLALAFASALAGWKGSSEGERGEVALVVVVPESTLTEHRILLEKHGVTIVPSSAAHGFAAVDAIAHQEVERRRAVLLYAPSKKDDARSIYEATVGAEIAQALTAKSELVDVERIVVPYGSGALLEGIARAVRAAGSAAKVVGAIAAHEKEPTRQDGVLREDDPRPSDVEVEVVTDKEAFAARMSLAKKEGFLVGLSSAGALAVALRRAKSHRRAELALSIDCGDRYFSVDHHFSSRDGI
jgi:cysteine synthase